MKRRIVASWALYDFANSAFTTLVVTFIYSAYFTQKIATDVTSGTVLWTRAVNASAVIVALATPVLGAIADAASAKKRFLLATTLACVLFTAALALPAHGAAVRAAFLFVLANVAFEMSNVFYNAFLPEISSRTTMGRISGAGWALGYAGGLACLALALVMIRGRSGTALDAAVRATNLLVAGWYLVFSIPLFVFVPEGRRGASRGALAAAASGVTRIGSTMRSLRHHREAAKLLLARLVYNDGLVTVFSFAAIFAAAAFGMSTQELIVLGIALNVAAGVGALAFGWVNDRIGGRNTILITLVVLVVATVTGTVAHRLWLFWAAAMVLGLMVGPNQSASRSLLAVLTPGDRHAEFFGFFAFSGKLASVAGPLVYGIVLEASGNQRMAMGSIAVFFLLGMVLLAFVHDPRPGRGGTQEES